MVGLFRAQQFHITPSEDAQTQPVATPVPALKPRRELIPRPFVEEAPKAKREAASKPMREKAYKRKVAKAPRLKFKFKVEFLVSRVSHGYSAYAQTEGILTESESIAELKTRMVEAVNLQYQDQEHTYTLADLKVTFDLGHLFDYFKMINRAEFAVRIGMPAELLELIASDRKKPNAREYAKIMNGLRDLGRELAGLELL
jgi:hypothetical protein